MSSVGAVSAALSGRGSRNADSASQDYEVIMPTLPTGSSVQNTIFLHADVRARPYRLEHFRDALARAALLPEVLALGAYQYNHVWAVTFRSAEGKKKLLATDGFTVKEGRCVVVDPNNQDTRLKLHWLLHHVQDEEVRVALAPFGKVTGITRDKWHVPGCMDMGSTTRSVTLKLAAGVTVEDIPHQLRIAGDLVLVVVPGRAPLCLRCKGKGHIRRECRVPRCASCRRFGHSESQCVRTYASVAGPVRSDDISEHLMDVADAEEAASGGASQLPEQAPAPLGPSGSSDESRSDGDRGRLPAATSAGGAPSVENVGLAKSSAIETPHTDKVEPKDVETEVPTAPVPKRARELSEKVSQNSGAAAPDEPPPKAPLTRRSSLRPKPNIPPDRSPMVTPPTQ
ncbi:uncharacterized protein LOC115315899 [Ixodes scapularis]|uniref:uncharacterized protein LOC115315899 n=1 Tax=Ixodes scapularis TaxID=6945 RepID=UPI001A9CD17B|nr:uncharacterized protein LOC115315899 [Ixodes scapularis]